MDGFSKVFDLSKKEMTQEEIIKEFSEVRCEFFQKRSEFEKALDTFEKSMQDCKIVFEELARQAAKGGYAETYYDVRHYFYSAAFTNQASAMRRMIDLRV